jgi:two-component system, OmpR family, response regulator
VSDKKHIPPERIRLLLVDDEEGYVNVLGNRLSRRGMDVQKALSGSQALQRVRNQVFDVVVLDLKMEGMDGLEVLQIFKQMDEEMEVIMLTGHGSQAAAQDGLSIGAFDYLMKPCELDELITKIQEAYEHKKINDNGLT